MIQCCAHLSKVGLVVTAFVIRAQHGAQAQRSGYTTE
jgi:hypothetical protein